MIVDNAQTTDRGPHIALPTASQPLKDNGVNVFALGIGSRIQDQNLRDIASKPTNVFKASLNQLTDTKRAIERKWRAYLQGIYINFT